MASRELFMDVVDAVPELDYYQAEITPIKSPEGKAACAAMYLLG